jgi:peptidase E
MTIYYLNGGEDIWKKGSSKLNKKIFSEIGKAPTVYVFSWSKELGFFDEYKKEMNEYFMNCGAKKVKFADKNKKVETLKKEALESDIIYLPGGSSNWFMKNALKYNLKEILNEFTGTIMSSSAGTMILAEKFTAFPGQYGREEIEIKDGLGILPINVVVHSTDEIYNEAIKLQEVKKPIYCIPEDQVIRIEGDSVELLGEDIKIIS